MPLLSLPTELLLDIIAQTIEIPDKVRPKSHCTSPNATALAHTCQHLRDLSLPFMYGSITVDLKSTIPLHALLDSTVHIAGFIRHVTVGVIHPNGARLHQDILKRCNRLLELRLGASLSSPDYATVLLAHLCLQSQPPIRLHRFGARDIMLCLSSAPRGLQTVWLEDSVTIGRFHSEPETTTPLTEVHTLICNSSCFLRSRTQSDGGAWLAPIMPNLQRLELYITGRSAALLEAYAELGTRLRELKVSIATEHPNICATVAKFAPELRRYVARGGMLCETLFKVDWACVEYLELVCKVSCRGVQLAELREGLLRVVAARPEASVRVAVEKGAELVAYKCGVGAVAPLEEFAAFQRE